MKKFYQQFFYIPKHAKVSDRVFKTRTALSVLTILVCCILFCSTTFAWFTSEQSFDVAALTAAEYSVKVTVDGETLTQDNNGNLTYTCPLAAEDKHSVTIAAAGTAETGYCAINAGGETYSTVQINKENSLSLTVVARAGVTLTFSANWGNYESIAAFSLGNEDSCRIGDGDYIEISATPYEEYTVAEGVTLEMIAEYYQVSASDILIFSGITESDVLPGIKIRIPNTTVTEPLPAPTEATDPTIETTEATEATEPSAEPSVPSTEPSAPPTEATEPSAEPSVPPTESTEPSAEPSAPSAEPSAPAAESLAPPEPADAPSGEAASE